MGCQVKMYTTQTCTIFLDTCLDLNQIYTWPIDDQLVSMKYHNEVKGAVVVEKVVKKSTKLFFENTIRAVMRPTVTATYKIHLKICRNGTIQLTGCKYKNDALEIYTYFWHCLGRNDISGVLVYYMTNLNHTLAFTLNKQKLIGVLSNAPFPAIIMHEPYFTYSGLLVKIPIMDDELSDQQIIKIVCKDGTMTTIPDKFYNLVNLIHKPHKKTTRRYISFLIFPSGKVNVSGISPELTQVKLQLMINYINLNSGLLNNNAPN